MPRRALEQVRAQLRLAQRPRTLGVGRAEDRHRAVQLGVAQRAQRVGRHQQRRRRLRERPSVPQLLRAAAAGVGALLERRTAAELPLEHHDELVEVDDAVVVDVEQLQRKLRHRAARAAACTAATATAAATAADAAAADAAATDDDDNEAHADSTGAASPGLAPPL